MPWTRKHSPDWCLENENSTSGTEITSLGTSGLSQIYDFLGSWHQSQIIKINSFDVESGILVFWFWINQSKSILALHKISTKLVTPSQLYQNKVSCLSIVIFRLSKMELSSSNASSIIFLSFSFWYNSLFYLPMNLAFSLLMSISIIYSVPLNSSLEVKILALAHSESFPFMKMSLQ